jgi:hypothetical protein
MTTTFVYVFLLLISPWRCPPRHKPWDANRCSGGFCWCAAPFPNPFRRWNQAGGETLIGPAGGGGGGGEGGGLEHGNILIHTAQDVYLQNLRIIIVVFIKYICKEIGPPGQKKVYSAYSTFSISQVLICYPVSPCETVRRINVTFKTLSFKGAGDYNLPGCLQLCLLRSVSSWADLGWNCALLSEEYKCTVRRHLICLCNYIMLPCMIPRVPFCTYVTFIVWVCTSTWKKIFNSRKGTLNT